MYVCVHSDLTSERLFPCLYMSISVVEHNFKNTYGVST